VAASLLLLANLVFFWPVVFHGRVFSSHDAALAVDPWRAASRVDVPRNRLLADAASAGSPMLRDLPARFFWNPYVAGGAPGAINLVQGFLSPFAGIPGLLLPEAFIETGILFLKLNAGFLFAFVFFDRRGLSETAASCGAAAWAWSTAQSTWWLWMQSSVMVCIPLLFLAADRARGRGSFFSAVAASAGASLLFLSGGYPFMILFGAGAATLYALFGGEGGLGRNAGRAAAGLTAGALLAAALVWPAIMVSARAIRETGQVEARAGLARTFELPVQHLLLYAFPLAAGDPLRDDYRPLTASPHDNFMETAVGVGPVALALALVGAAGRRNRRLYGWAMGLALGTAAALYVPPVRRLFEDLPLLSAGLFERIKILAVLGIAVSAAVGADVVAEIDVRRSGRRMAPLLPFLIGLPLLAVAARFYPAVLPKHAVFAATPGLRALARRGETAPARMLATGWTLYPDLASAEGLEDVRGHLFFERDYRRLLAAADPGIYGRTGTLLVSEPATLAPLSPVLDLLNVATIAAPPGFAFAPAALEKIYDGPDLTLFRRPSPLPRYFLAERWERGGVESVARASRETLATTAFVDGDVPPRSLAERSEPSRVIMEESTSASFRLRLRAGAPEFLVTSQKLFPPYWTARIDGRSVSPVRVDGLFFGLPIPRGEHIVEGAFRLPRRELAVSAVAALLLLAGAAVSIARGRAA